MPLRTPIIPPDIQPAYPLQIADPDVRPKLIELLGLPEIPAALDLTTAGFDEANGVRSTHLTYFNSLRLWCTKKRFWPKLLKQDRLSG